MLFEEAPLVTWLGNETVFSLAARHHRLSGNALARSTCLQLFKHHRLGSQHDFPSRIQVLADQARGTLGTADSIIRGHTILPYYLALRPKSEALDAFATLRGPAIGGLKYRLGITSSGFGANHPLKACEECRVLDEHGDGGVGYWHREHQLPGAWVCQVHGAPLSAAGVKSNGVGRFQWYLPDDIEDGLWVCPARNVSTQAAARLLQLSTLAQELCAFEAASPITANALARCYRRGLGQRGLTRGASLRLSAIGSEFNDFLIPICGVGEFRTFARDPQTSAEQIARMVRTPRVATHPLRHLLLISWLFEEWNAFAKTYSTSDHGTVSVTEGEADGRGHPDPRLVRVLDLMSVGGLSASAAAQEVGISTTTATVWASKAGLPVVRRPKTLKPNTLAEIVCSLQTGAEKKVVAYKHAVTLQAVTRILQREPGLRDQWNDARRREALQGARRELLDLLTARPHLGMKELRLACPRAYAWLYRNDRDWLSNVSKTRPQYQRSMPPRIDWDHRDRELSQATYEAAARLGTKGEGRVALWKLYQAVPDLRAKLSALDRLPLTTRALDEVSRRRKRTVTSTSKLFD
jgi:transposase